MSPELLRFWSLTVVWRQICLWDCFHTSENLILSSTSVQKPVAWLFPPHLLLREHSLGTHSFQTARDNGGWLPRSCPWIWVAYYSVTVWTETRLRLVPVKLSLAFEESGCGQWRLPCVTHVLLCFTLGWVQPSIVLSLSDSQSPQWTLLGSFLVLHTCL